MFYEIGNLNKRGKCRMGQKYCIDCQNEAIILEKKTKFNKYFQSISLNIIDNSISKMI